MFVHIRGKTLSVLDSETDVSVMTGTTAEPQVTSAMRTLSRKPPRLFVKNEVMTSSTSVNITGLEHFTEYMVKVS